MSIEILPMENVTLLARLFLALHLGVYSESMAVPAIQHDFGHMRMGDQQ